MSDDPLLPAADSGASAGDRPPLDAPPLADQSLADQSTVPTRPADMLPDVSESSGDLPATGDLPVPGELVPEAPLAEAEPLAAGGSDATVGQDTGAEDALQGLSHASTTPAMPVSRRKTSSPEEAITPGGWLPSLRQVADAARLDMASALGPEPDWPFFTRGRHSSMRQAMGLIAFIVLIAGLPTLISTWMGLAESHTTLQLLQAQGVVRRLITLPPAGLLPDLDAELQKTGELVGGLMPVASAQAAAGLSALSAWLALPIRAWTLWLAYGVLVLIVAKALGAGTTLHRFYAATGYAVVPLLLALFLPVPLLGPWVAVVGGVLALFAYVLAVAAVTGLDRWHALISTLLPAAVLALLFAIASVALLLLLF